MTHHDNAGRRMLRPLGSELQSWHPVGASVGLERIFVGPGLLRSALFPGIHAANVGVERRQHCRCLYVCGSFFHGDRYILTPSLTSFRVSPSMFQCNDCEDDLAYR